NQLLNSPPLRGGRTPWRPGGALRAVGQRRGVVTFPFQFRPNAEHLPDLEIASHCMSLPSQTSPYTRRFPHPAATASDLPKRGGETARIRLFDRRSSPDYPEEPKNKT